MHSLSRPSVEDFDRSGWIDDAGRIAQLKRSLLPESAFRGMVTTLNMQWLGLEFGCGARFMVRVLRNGNDQIYALYCSDPAVVEVSPDMGKALGGASPGITGLLPSDDEKLILRAVGGVGQTVSGQRLRIQIDLLPGVDPDSLLEPLRRVLSAQKGELKLDFAFLYGDLVGYDLFVLIGHDEEVRRAAVADMLEATEGWPLVRARPEGE